ncbi:hypothetical protein ACFLZV_05570 [Candidatus Margulisiibacteriota bacterium]
MKKLFIFVLLPIVLTTTGEFLLKYNINNISAPNYNSQATQSVKTFIAHIIPSEKIAAKSANAITVISSYCLMPQIVFATAFIIIGGILWLVAMSKYQLSFLYPFLSINYICIIIGSQIFLDEKVSLFRYLSICLIILGLIIISKSPHINKKQEEEI